MELWLKGFGVCYSSVCIHVRTYVTLDEQFSTCTQQHVLHTPYTYVYMQIKYCEVLLIPGGYNRLQYFVTFTCCTIMYVVLTVLKLTVTRQNQQTVVPTQPSPLNVGASYSE